MRKRQEWTPLFLRAQSGHSFAPAHYLVIICRNLVRRGCRHLLALSSVSLQQDYPIIIIINYPVIDCPSAADVCQPVDFTQYQPPIMGEYIKSSPLGADDIAIVGFSFQLPRDLADEDSFWNAVQGKKNQMTDWPESRLSPASFANAEQTKVRKTPSASTNHC